MNYSKVLRLSILIALIIMALGVVFIAGKPAWIEIFYAQRLFPAISLFQRRLTAGIPFSLGDLLYCFAAVYLLLQLSVFFRRLLEKSDNRWYQLRPLANLFVLLLFFWVYFYAFWGLNYYRLGIAYQLEIKKGSVQLEELHAVTRLLIHKANHSKQRCLERGDTLMSRDRLYQAAGEAYAVAAGRFPFLRFHVASIKPSMFGTLGNYAGFLGYYNPFTGEAQLNVKGPSIVQPFVVCHEMAHQLGYASESEANFVAFIVGSSSRDTVLQYSTYLDMLMYAAGNLWAADSSAALQLRKEIHPAVLQDMREYRDFYRRHRIFLTDWVDRFYDWYLRANRQEKGLNSYSEVVSWLIAYERKYGLEGP